MFLLVVVPPVPSLIPVGGCVLVYFDNVGAADLWYKGLTDAALERNISLQFCLPSTTDMLVSLPYPAGSQIPIP